MTNRQKKLRLEPGIQQKAINWAAVNFKKCMTTNSTPEPTIWSCDTGQQKLCFDSCQLTITRRSYIKVIISFRFSSMPIAMLHDVRMTYAPSPVNNKPGTCP